METLRRTHSRPGAQNDTAACCQEWRRGGKQQAITSSNLIQAWNRPRAKAKYADSARQMAGLRAH